MSTFVAVGNATQPFRRLLDEVALIAAELPQPVIVQHGSTPFQSEACKGIGFVDMAEFERLVAEAELLILHAGAGSVIHAVRAGKVPVLMARLADHGEHVDDHQREFAGALERAGRAVVANEPGDLAGSVLRAFELQRRAGKGEQTSPMLRLVDEMLSNYARQFP